MVTHGVRGRSPGRGGGVGRGRQQLEENVEVGVRNALACTAGYQWFTGAKGNNVLRDRDFAQLGARYRF